MNEQDKAAHKAKLAARKAAAGKKAVESNARAKNHSKPSQEALDATVDRLVAETFAKARR